MMSTTPFTLVPRGTLLALALTMPLVCAFAQMEESPAPQTHSSARYKRQTLDDKIAVLSKNLELTEPQRVSVKRILEERQQQTIRIRNADVPGNVRIDRFRLLQETTITQIRAILTDEQKKKYDPLISRTRPAAGTPQRSVEDWIKATTPH